MHVFVRAVATLAALVAVGAVEERLSAARWKDRTRSRRSRRSHVASRPPAVVVDFAERVAAHKFVQFVDTSVLDIGTQALKNIYHVINIINLLMYQIYFKY